jgi:hypothetical protein
VRSEELRSDLDIGQPAEAQVRPSRAGELGSYLRVVAGSSQLTVRQCCAGRQAAVRRRGRPGTLDGSPPGTRFALWGSITRFRLGDLPGWRSSLGDLLGRLLVCALSAQMPDVRGQREVCQDAGLLVLRQENAVLRRQIGRVRCQPGDRLWLAALSRLIPPASLGSGVRRDCGGAACLAPAAGRGQLG